MEILVQVMVRDVLQFLIVFAVITISFGGGLYFSLLTQPCTVSQSTTAMGFSSITNTSLCLHPDETRFTLPDFVFVLIFINLYWHSELYLSWLTGIRLLVEGSIIDPYIFGDQGFW